MTTRTEPRGVQLADTSRQVAVGQRPWVPLALLVAGTVAIVFGVGVGIRWLTTVGVSWQAILGLASLGVGLWLVALGSMRLVRHRRKWTTWLVVPSLWVGVALVVWTLSPALIATMVPPTPLDRTPGDVGLEAEQVNFATADGVELAGWYVPSENGAAVVLRHGSGANSGAALGHAVVLADHGFGVLVTDARGHGRSGGRAMDFGWNGDADISAAVSYLQDRPDVDGGSIGVVGLSMGGEEAIGAIGSVGGIAAVVAEGATARTEADKVWLEEIYGWRGSLQVTLESIQYWFTSLLADAERPVALAESVGDAGQRPVLLIAGGAVPDEVHAARHIASGGGNIAVWVIPNAGHIGGLDTAPDEWESHVVDFLEDALLD